MAVVSDHGKFYLPSWLAEITGAGRTYRTYRVTDEEWDALVLRVSSVIAEVARAARPLPNEVVHAAERVLRELGFSIKETR